MTNTTTGTQDDQNQEPPRPDINAGLAYWNSVAQQDITNNGVLGGFGNGSLPRVDAMGSRMFLLTIRPELSKIKPPYQQTSHPPTQSTESQKSGRSGRRYYRALDVGAGIGRVTADVLLYLFDRIDLVEPVAGFIETGKRNASNGKWAQLTQDATPINDPLELSSQSPPSSKAVRFWKKSIQAFEPSEAIVHLSSPSAPIIMISDSCSIVGPKDGWNDGCGYDVIWAQWTLGHLSDEELVDFLKKCKESLRPAGRCLQTSSSTSSDSDPPELDDDDDDSRNLQARADEKNHDEEVSVLAPPTFERDGGLIIIKENIFVSQSDPDGDNFLFDKEDSSLTRSHQSFLRIFKQAGLRLIKQEIQRGFDPDLYRVNFYALQ
ncbi:hypothetical protein PGT21_014313 [Puccinia graminis f. sp. tritici]|uniref:Alpha N-terminal protein methyltransferase 1 n=2 Tax=Puccinia graminis f. sp. tritici TaxID=56615 RepID=A0A5B0LSQ6_PUCGR|nr:hypothetical protein PGTUg99_016458 [Puccinia graminis f. sp. tritici]KAA1071653.1 hypothetical protein PGT21_014313 [Puccinia graminis f. sp. tritici]